ncbi:MAG TPA: tRNA (adenosine(37)-N6)-dimethylallyltransferase MiaA [Burkholderiales bacterium]|nr:tRNA (adenosine(37)-N6)-dimethylallyltransferase MiaA [Burkholderiales bacterium]
MQRKAYALLGPTASGKSALAVKAAEKLPLEIVSMDSALVYRGMDIGTAKPGAALRAQVPHHLIDIIDPDQSYSAGRWREDAIRTVTEILDRKHVPLLVGGTMLYYRALTAGLDELPQADARIRADIDADAARRGWPALHAELESVDARAAKRIAPNDAQRIQRALEVWRVTGKPLSDLQGVARKDLPFELTGIALIPERAVLHERIGQRFDAMLRLGLVDELKGLKKKYRLNAAMPSMRAVGYRQVWEYLENKSDKATMRERAIVATRQLAKRQLTWLRSFPDLVRLDAGGAQDPAVALHLLLDEGRQLVRR